MVHCMYLVLDETLQLEDRTTREQGTNDVLPDFGHFGVAVTERTFV